MSVVTTWVARTSIESFPHATSTKRVNRHFSRRRGLISSSVYALVRSRRGFRTVAAADDAPRLATQEPLPKSLGAHLAYPLARRARTAKVS